ncbi:HCP-like protein [Polychaeton citri CBS 116435]|uniref:HCP-like protein n=1 Tax=Polychaeton citri CBS 116435 TaxID=1314669 RepID=A0A9P4PYA9_9PEZI|nr:HCP-like protein [Polychaeton citri CBS 116435]
MKCGLLRLILLGIACCLALSTLVIARESAQGLEQQEPLQDGRQESSNMEWDGEEERDVQAERVRDAVEVLQRTGSPKASHITNIGRRPKGLMGTAAYYAKQAFIILFMNSPKQSSMASTTSKSSSTLAQPFSKPVRQLQAAAREGNSDALFLLAEMNFHGNYTHPIDYPTAFNYYKQLADRKGNSTAQHMLGLIYATGLSPKHPADQAKSMLYHTFAAEQGNTRSEMTLAYRHHAGVSTPRDCDEAVHWYKKVADKAIAYYRSGPPGGHSLARDAVRLADEDGGVYGEGASFTSSGPNARRGGPTSDAYADVDDVLEYLHFQHTKGDIKATFGLARIHYDGGRGLKRDLKLAKRYFLDVARSYWSANGKAVHDVSPSTERLASKAAGYLGRMFLRGEGIEQSLSKARIWFARGIQNSDALSLYSLGLMYLEGLGVDQNTVKAGEYFGAAADQNLAVAQTNLGKLFLDQGDVVTAAKYFELAARNHHIEALYYLAELTNQGVGGERSCGLAVSYYKLVSEKAEPIWSSLGEANEAYEDGNKQKAIIGYMMAAEQGSEAAQANVAWLLDQTKPHWSPLAWFSSAGENAKSIVGDAALALMYWTRSARQQNVDSLVKMGDYYLLGLGLPSGMPSPDNAAACYQAAAETMMSAQAMWNLGWMHENGIGLAQDFHLAKRYYDQALETNPEEALLPVKLSLWKLRWRSWWNGVTGGTIRGVEEEIIPEKQRTFSEFVNEFLEADAQMYAQEHYEDDDWESHEGFPGDDGFYDNETDLDDGILDTLLIGALLAGLAWLFWYRQQQARAAEQRPGQALDGEPAHQGHQPQQPQQPQHQQLQEQPAPGQQPDGGLFPRQGDPNLDDWVAGGIGH